MDKFKLYFSIHVPIGVLALHKFKCNVHNMHRQPDLYVAYGRHNLSSET